VAASVYKFAKCHAAQQVAAKCRGEIPQVFYDDEAALNLSFEELSA
jgi:hypothetical protein